MKTIDQDVLGVLQASTCDGATIKLPKMQLDRKLYMAVNKVFDNLGGKWNRKRGPHIFLDDVSDAFAEVQRTGQYEAKLDELNKIYNYFPTPENVAHQLVALADIRRGETILEPSAGRGSIAEVVFHDSPPDCIELNSDNRKILSDKGFNLVGEDFMDFNEPYDVIIANPPFSNSRDAKHILHMIKLAKRRVVSICSGSIMFRENGAYGELRAWLDASPRSRIIPLPEGAFKESGTMVETCIVVAETS